MCGVVGGVVVSLRVSLTPLSIHDGEKGPFKNLAKMQKGLLPLNRISNLYVVLCVVLWLCFLKTVKHSVVLEVKRFVG